MSMSRREMMKKIIAMRARKNGEGPHSNNNHRSLLSRAPIDDNPKTNGEYAFFNQNKHLFKTVFFVGAAHDEDYINSTSSDVQFYLFEPNQERYKELIITLGHKPNVTIECFGLSDKNEEVDYYADTLSCVKRTHDIQSKSVPVKIPLRRLDDYCFEKKIENIDYMKIDTEGFETPILVGGSDIVKNTTFILFEYGGCWKDTKYFLQSLYNHFPTKQFGELMPNGSWENRPNAIEDFRYTNYIMTNKTTP
jgi:FkbM family methyltransferase